MATTIQDLVAKVKNLVALAPVLGANSRPAIGQNPFFCFLLSNWQIVCLFIHIGAQYLYTRLKVIFNMVHVPSKR